MTGERLLVVDDEPTFGAFVRRVAQELDFVVEVTTNARDFKAAYARFDPTVIVLDIVMPTTDGIELAQWLASARCKARVLVISGFDPRYARSAEILGSLGGLVSIKRLAKPVTMADLKEALLGPTAPDAA